MGKLSRSYSFNSVKDKRFAKSKSLWDVTRKTSRLIFNGIVLPIW